MLAKLRCSLSWLFPLCCFGSWSIDYTLKVVIAFPILVKYYKPSDLVKEGALGQSVTSACNDAFFLPFCEVQFLIDQAVGVEASWYDGCWCHEAILTDATSRYKRSKAMAEATGDESGQCPHGWTGKRLSALALGHCKKMNEKIKNSRSVRYAAALVAAEPNIRNRIVIIEHGVKDYITAEYAEKLDYALHIPHKIAGAFGYLCGYGTLDDCKTCVRECIDEFDAVTDMGQHDYVSAQLFSVLRAVRAQFVSFGATPGTDLRRYPDAYLEAKERAFASNSERCTEGEHVKVKAAQQRGLRYGKPAYVGARKRKPQMCTMLDKADEKEWVIQHWADRRLFPEVMSFIASQVAVVRLTLAQRHAKIYGYERTANYADTSLEEKYVLALTDARSKVAAKPVVTTDDNMQMIVNFLKNQFQHGRVFSVPKTCLQKAMEKGHFDQPTPVSADGFVNLMQWRVLDETAPGETAFFEIVDARPEAKVQLVSGHVKRLRTCVQIKVLDLISSVGSLVVKSCGSLEMIDLARWCGEENFEGARGGAHELAC